MGGGGGGGGNRKKIRNSGEGGGDWYTQQVLIEGSSAQSPGPGPAPSPRSGPLPPVRPPPPGPAPVVPAAPGLLPKKDTRSTKHIHLVECRLLIKLLFYHALWLRIFIICLIRVWMGSPTDAACHALACGQDSKDKVTVAFSSGQDTVDQFILLRTGHRRPVYSPQDRTP